MTSASIVGGGYVKEVLSAAELKLVQAALAAAAGSKAVHILTPTSPAAINAGVDYNVFNPSATANAVYDMTPGYDAIIVGGPVPKGGALPSGGGVTINGHAGQEILVSELSKDTINAKGGSGYVFTGAGADTVNTNDVGLAAGALDIVTGTGKNIVNMWGGAVTVSAAGQDTVNLLFGNNTIVGSGLLNVSVTAGANAEVNLTPASATDTVTGNATIDLNHVNTYKLTLNGNDTISFGSGSDTITSSGKATIQSSSSGVTVTAGAGSESAMVGTAAATLISGSGTSTLAGGTATNVFMAGKGKDTLIANTGASSNQFDFTNETVGGGKHTLQNFVTGQDHISLIGYGAGEVATALANAHVVGGSTVTHLDDGTTITLTGYTHLTAGDFI